MKEMVLCIVACSITMTLGTLPVFDSETTIDIDHKAFRMMDCEPLVDLDGKEVRGADDCIFGGHYPRSHPLEYDVTLLMPPTTL